MLWLEEVWTARKDDRNFVERMECPIGFTLSAMIMLGSNNTQIELLKKSWKKYMMDTTRLAHWVCDFRGYQRSNESRIRKTPSYTKWQCELFIFGSLAWWTARGHQIQKSPLCRKGSGISLVGSKINSNYGAYQRKITLVMNHLRPHLANLQTQGFRLL